MYINPTYQDFQTQLPFDFPYGTNPDTSVLNSEINAAFMMVNVNINQALFADQSTYTFCYNLLAAHYLTLNLRASSQGKDGKWEWSEQSKGVGPANVSFAIPQRILDNPYFSMLTSTNYGATYLQLLLPQLSGAVSISYGRTLP